MNCSESQRLRTLLSCLLLELHHQGNASGLGTRLGPNRGMGVVPDTFFGREVTSPKGDDAYLYILLIMIFYACLAGGLILAYTRSPNVPGLPRTPVCHGRRLGRSKHRDCRWFTS